MNAAALMEVEALSCGYGSGLVASGVSFRLGRGEILCLLGPNGVGKTTLFKTILRLLPPRAGRVLIGGEDVAGWSRRRFAATVGYVPQAHVPPFPFTVRDVVVMGRVARFGPFGSPGGRDMDAAERALDELSISRLAGRSYTGLSGGERQLVLLARALAQEPDILILDEPTSNLDFGNQLLVLERVRELAAGAGKAVIMTTHDPNHALLYGDRAAAMARGGGFDVGRPAEVVTARYLRETYGVEPGMVRLKGPDGGEVLACLPLARESRGGHTVATAGKPGAMDAMSAPSAPGVADAAAATYTRGR